MADYVLLDGVCTWYDEQGDGDPLVLLHPGGAGVDARAFGANVKPLAARFRVYTPERRAHGRTPDVAGPITFDAMATDTIAFLEAVVGRRAHVVGCSDGGIVGLLVALRCPDLIDRWCWSPACSTSRAGFPRSSIRTIGRQDSWLASMRRCPRWRRSLSGSRGQAGKDVQRRTDDQG